MPPPPCAQGWFDEIGGLVDALSWLSLCAGMVLIILCSGEWTKHILPVRGDGPGQRGGNVGHRCLIPVLRDVSFLDFGA